MKRIVAIGGGQGKGREQDPSRLKIDEYLAGLAREHAGERRACCLFLPTASHDCMPYYNTFHKVYTGVYGLKTDVALTVGRDVDLGKHKKKFDGADLIYVGGGNTVFMLEHWRKVGLIPLIEEAYGRGVPLAGLSAGGICWFEEMYSDSVVQNDYAMYRGLGWLKGTVSPHYNERTADFDEIVLRNRLRAWGIEDYAALEFVDGTPKNAISAGGKVWLLDASTHAELTKTQFSGE